MLLEKTITSIFMVPTLEICKYKMKTNGFLNGYIDDVGKEDKYNDCIYLLFLPEDIDRFKKFLETEYERTVNVIEDYDYPEGYVVVIYKLNHKYKEDFELIKKGEYSKTSMSFQNLFPTKVDIVNEDNKLIEHESLQYQIFNKVESLRDYWETKLNENFKNLFPNGYELWSGFDPRKEVLDINKIKNPEDVN